MAGFQVSSTPSGPHRPPSWDLTAFHCIKNGVSCPTMQARYLPLLPAAVGRLEDLMCIRMATTGNPWSREQAHTA